MIRFDLSNVVNRYQMKTTKFSLTFDDFLMSSTFSSSSLWSSVPFSVLELTSVTVRQVIRASVCSSKMHLPFLVWPLTMPVESPVNRTSLQIAIPLIRAWCAWKDLVFTPTSRALFPFSMCHSSIMPEARPIANSFSLVTGL